MSAPSAAPQGFAAPAAAKGTAFLWPFLLGWIILSCDRTSLFPLLSVIGREFDLSGVRIGSITSSFFVTYALMQIPGGALADRWGYRRTLGATYALAGLALVGIAAGGVTYALLLVFVGLHGLGAGAYFPSAFGYILTRSAPERRAFNAALVFTGVFVGLGFGLLLAGPLYEALASWRAPFVLLAVPTLAVAAYYFLRLREVAPPRSAGTFKNLLLDRSVIAVLIANFCSLYGFWLAVSWGPAFLQAERNLSVTGSGVLTALYAAAAIPASLLVGRVSDRFGRRRVCLALFPPAAAAVLAMAFADSQLWLGVSLVAFGALGKPAVEPVMIAWIGGHVSRVKPEAMGSTMGVVNFIGQLSGILAPVLTGWIRDVTGSLEGAFFLGAGVVFCGFLLCLLARE